MTGKLFKEFGTFAIACGLISIFVPLIEVIEDHFWFLFITGFFQVLGAMFLYRRFESDEEELRVVSLFLMGSSFVVSSLSMKMLQVITQIDNNLVEGAIVLLGWGALLFLFPRISRHVVEIVHFEHKIKL